MSDLNMWVGSSALNEGILKLAAGQVDACTESLRKYQRDENPARILKSLGSVFNFLTVRVRACYDLPNKDGGIFGGSVDVYVVVVAEASKDCYRTKGVLNDLNPQWSHHGRPYEEFFLSVQPEAQRFTLQVWGDNGSSEPTRFGFVTPQFRDTPGTWQRKRARLFNMRTRKMREHGEIEYEYCFANCVEHLKTCRA